MEPLFPIALVYIALAFQATGFIARDELILRILVLTGTFFYLAFYRATMDENTSIHAIIASGVLGVVNLGMIILLIFERTTFAMSDEMEEIYQSFPTLNPGQFRKVMAAGVMKEAKPGKVLVTDGAPLDRLILVTKGQVNIAKGDSEYQSDARVFIGEVSFLREGSASATVSVSKDAKYVEWHHDDLRKMMSQSHAMDNALTALFGAELAGKVENAMPIDVNKAKTS